MKRTSAILLIAGRILFHAFALVVLFQASAARAEAPPPVIRIGLAAAPTGSPPVYTVGNVGLAIHKGWFAEEFKADGTKVEIVYFKGAGPAVNEALTNSQLDFAFQGDLASIIGKAAGLKTKLIAVSTKFTNIYLAVPADSPIRSIKDLRGKRVAIFKGTNAQLPIDRLLEANGMTERDLRAINLDWAGGLAAVASRNVDAAFGYTEMLKLRDRGAARIVYASGNDSPIYTRQAHLLVTDEFARKYPETTTRVVKVLVKAARWISDEANREEVYRQWALMGSASVANWIEDEGKRSLRERMSPLFDPFIVSHYQRTVDHGHKLRLVRSRFDVEAWIDRRYLDAALKSLKLEGYWRSYDANGIPIASAR